MLGSNLSSVSNQDSPKKNENEASTQNNLSTPKKKDSPSKKSKQKSPIRNSKKASPSKNVKESSKRLRTIESFLISSPKAKRTKNCEFNDINDNKVQNTNKELDKGEDVIVIDDNNNNSNVDNNFISGDKAKDNVVILIEKNDKKDIKIKDNDEENIDNKDNDKKIKNDNSNEKMKINDNKKNSQNNIKKENVIEENDLEEKIIEKNIEQEDKKSNSTKNENDEKSENLSSDDREDNEYDSDISIETLSSFTSSDLDIDPEVESRLNSQASSMSVDIEESQVSIDNNDDDKKKENKSKKTKKGKTKTETKTSKKINSKKESKKENKKDSKKNNKNKENKCEKLESGTIEEKKEIKKDSKNDNENKNENKNEISNKSVQNGNDITNKSKNKVNIEDIPDNEIVELKNKRVIFHEKKIQIDTLSETLIELLCFHEFKNSQTEPIPKIPERFNSLIAKLVQDSDATENNLVNSVYQSLSPTDEDDESEQILLKSAVLPAIRNVSVRRNYGIEKEGAYYPNLAIWRWEVKDLNWLTKNIQEKIKLRRLRRERASQILKNIVDNMSEEERNNLFRSKKRKSILVEENKTNDNKESNTDTENKTSNNSKSDEKNEKNEKNDSSTKENEKRKIDLLQGQRSIAGFFSPIKKKKVEEKSIPETIQEKQNMEFDNRFKSFYIKSNTEIAPLNYFKDIKVEYNFDDDDRMDCDDEETSLDNYLSIIRERKIQNIIKKRKEEKEKQLLEKEIIDLTEDIAIPHYKMKLLQFFENHRPAYYGTWRKNTKIISGRHPFKKDTELLDYEFDSEIEWVADEEGEECLSDEEDDEEDDIIDNEQGDDDGWLVPHGYLSDDEGVEEDIDKVKLDKKNNDPKPMKVVPLIPVIIGPIYAEYSYDEIPQENLMLGQFSAQLVDSDMDIDLPLDPFKEYPTNDESNSNNNPTEESEKNEKKIKIVFPEEYLSIFIKIVEYSLKGMVKIIDEAKEMEEFKNIPKIQIEKKLREIAVKEKPEGASKICWCVKDEVYEKLNITKPGIPESLKIENSVKSPKMNKNIFNKTIKSPSSEKKKPMKEPLLNFLPKKKNISVKPNTKKTDSTIIIDLENEKI